MVTGYNRHMKYALFILMFFIFAIPFFLNDARIPANDIGFPALRVVATEVYQGDPVFIVFQGIRSESILKFSVGVEEVSYFIYHGQLAALYGFDLNAKPGKYEITAELLDGRVASTTVVLKERPKKEALLGIPEKLGGNTAESQKKLVASLQEENSILNNIDSASEALWYGPFIKPLSSSTITDEYGYTRITGAYTIPHKGTDLRAANGTEVFAMNDGEVSLAREFRVYGKTVAIDHGLGIQTIYMHLSEIKVQEGERIIRGQKIALSGSTGYAAQPHLHVSVRISGISIDPVVFLGLFQSEL